MNKIQKCVVIIPIYKKELSVFEQISFLQGLKIINQPIVMIYPNGMNISNYKHYIKEYALENKIKYSFKAYPEKYFQTVYGYNELMMLPLFYKDFSLYDYMLIYQLDAYIFEDNLHKYMESGIDYIGAPCFEGYNKAIEVRYAGHLNGGLSLRKINSCLKVCERAQSASGILLLFQKHYLGKKDLIDIVCHKCRIKNKKYEPYRWEDMFFSFAAKILYPDFKVASFEQAYSFAFDCLPWELYEINGRNLPMGCHAFHKGNKADFWREFIKELQ